MVSSLEFSASETAAKAAASSASSFWLGQFLGPELGQVEVAAAVVQLAGLALRGLVLQQERAGGAVQGVGQDLGAGVAGAGGEVLEADGQGEELTQAVPAQVVFA